MDRAVAVLLLLAGCALEQEPNLSTAIPEQLRYLELEQVTWDSAQALIDDVEQCVGRPSQLAGWRLYVAQNVVRADCNNRLVFRCPDGAMTECEADGHTHCSCGGLTLYWSRIVVVAPDRVGLRHELIHAGYGVMGHGSDPEWECAPR